MEMFSMLALSTKKRYPSFFEKKVFVFRKSCFNAKVLKAFKISSHFIVKTFRFLKRRLILKIRSNLCSSCCL